MLQGNPGKGYMSGRMNNSSKLTQTKENVCIKDDSSETHPSKKQNLVYQKYETHKDNKNA